MKTKLYNLEVSYADVLELARQLNTKDRALLIEELRNISEDRYLILKERVIQVMRIIKPYITKNIGKNTHKKTTKDWAYYGLAFTHEEMVYVFGFNIGFFKTKESDYYNQVGVNVLVRTNGEKQEFRQNFVSFFREHLKGWVNRPEGIYSSDRGGEGIEFARYKALDYFKSDDEIIEFLKETIDGINKLYPDIIENKNGLFDNVVRAAPQWQEQIIDVCKNYID